MKTYPLNNAGYNRLLRHYSVTDGLARGTGLVDSVVFTAAFALLPGFGVYGLFLSVAIQDTISGCLDIPFGWVADRFGWAKAAIVSFSLRCATAALMLVAVLCAWWGHGGWAWTCVVLNAALDAFAGSLQNGAYEAAYSEWYRLKILKELKDPSSSPPPLFIRSLRYSMGLRFLIPASIVLSIMLLQKIPGLGNMSTYLASVIALSFAFAMNVLTFLRIYSDLAPLLTEEKERISKHKKLRGIELAGTIFQPVKNNLSAFILYTLACFQYGIAGAFLAGIAMKEMNKLEIPQPYGWLAGVSFILSIYFLDTIFWMAAGYKLQKNNASVWIRNLGLVLLFSCLLAVTIQLISPNPLVQSLSLGACVLSGILCAGAVKRFFASHIREWLDSDFVATWFSVASGISALAKGALGAVVIYLDKFIPNAVLLLFVSLLITVGIIYYLTSGALTNERWRFFSHKLFR